MPEDEIQTPIEAVEITSESLDLDIERLVSRVAEVLNDDIYWFPVRHHSPAVAHRVREAIETRKPKVVFIEGPSDANHLIPFLLDSKTKPPVAVYCSFRDEENKLELAGVATASEEIPFSSASWFPMLSYSPELVALQVCKELGVPSFFIDLPYHTQAARHIERVKRSLPKCSLPGEEDETASGSDSDQKESSDCSNIDDSTNGNDDDTDSAPGADAGASRQERNLPENEIAVPDFSPEHLIAESLFFKRLTELSGFKSWDEAWDALFEIRKFQDMEHFRKEFALFCGAVRATTSRFRMQWDGTLDRESFMNQTIMRTLSEKNLEPRDAMVICGGFHLFMDKRVEDEDTFEPPEGKTYVTLVPYSYFRVSELSGYGAGNRAPLFYQTLFTDMASRRKAVDAESQVLSR
ncbi:MAG: hypothetical protein K2Z81_03445, partial [Cyanobacteria bacterium]|nr:hypothetical protein [Cyanobacteriota bacterium]